MFQGVPIIGKYYDKDGSKQWIVYIEKYKCWFNDKLDAERLYKHLIKIHWKQQEGGE